MTFGNADVELGEQEMDEKLLSYQLLLSLSRASLSLATTMTNVVFGYVAVSGDRVGSSVSPQQG